MKVSNLIRLLEKEDQHSEVFAYLGAEQGYKIVDIGQEGVAVIGKGRADGDRSFVLLPIQVPSEFEPWSKESNLDGTLCRNGYPIDDCKCC